MSFVRYFGAITNPIKHVRSLITEKGNARKSTHPGKLQITQGSQSILVSALVVPKFKDNLIYVRQITNKNKIVLANDRVYLQDKSYPSSSAKFIGGRGSTISLHHSRRECKWYLDIARYACNAKSTSQYTPSRNTKLGQPQDNPRLLMHLPQLSCIHTQQNL